MAKNCILAEAVKMLEHSNYILRIEVANCTEGDRKKEELLAKIARNESMILDYNFRLKQQNT